MKTLVLPLMLICLILVESAAYGFYSKPVTRESVLQLIEKARKQGLETDVYIQTLQHLEESKFEDESAYIEGVQTTYRNLQEHMHRKLQSKSSDWQSFARVFLNKILDFKLIPPGGLAIFGEITNSGAIKMLCLSEISRSKDADHCFLAKLFLLSEIAPLPMKELDHIDFKLVYSDKEVSLYLYANNFEEPFLSAKRPYKKGSKQLPATDPSPYPITESNQLLPEVLGPKIIEDGIKKQFYGD